MNQEKIGRFITELRKEKKMTQIDLANKLGITDRAISKWENGRGMPDLSLLPPLCEILDVSINELLSGARLDKKDYQEKLEENIINTIDYTDKKIRKTKKIFIITISIILMFIVMLMVMYGIDINRMRNNKPVVFSTWGYSYVPPIDLKEEEIELAIMDYLIEKGDSEPTHHENEKTFASMRVYLIEEKERDKHYNIYAWVLEEKHYLENDEIKQDSGSSIPYKFVVKSIDGKFTVTDSRIPRDGSYYSVDMKNIFPDSVINDMDDVHTDGTIERLKLDIEQQTKLYFNK
ncbi:MAG: helix-turn-helix transcriptional regulator [Clostridia bacterium]|nr:helix-turn-helix transcriptional regulator [Bacilli bacterium]MBO5476911.1 helix-turn-helix transcriptional regulator [Clostridia bacterium]MBR4003557.1 helix-turn-helix transcriptional regulator [Clostridia bacterium]